jgi:bla regulator protein blaR1
MLRALLADRFKLVVHKESREMPIYALVTARSDKKFGPQIHPTTIDCAALAAQSTLREKEGKEKSKEERGSAPLAKPAAGQRPPCTMMMAPGRMSASAMTMATLASSLSGSVQRTVLDQTGIKGTFDLDLTWTPDRMPQGSAGGNPPGKSKALKIDPNGPSIFSALQEQLGLKLESTKGPVDVLVIDHVHPTEN